MGGSSSFEPAPRYAAEAVRSVRHAFAKQLSEPAARLSRTQTVAVLDEIVAKGNSVVAGRTMAYARACYSWAEKRGMVPLNPFRNLPVSAATTERERVLSDHEVRDIWTAAAATSYPFGPFYHIAILPCNAVMKLPECGGRSSLRTAPPG